MNPTDRTLDYAYVEHPSAEQLNAFVLGRLDERSSAEVERHVAECPLCGKLLEASPDDSFVALFQGAYSTSTVVGGAAPVAPSGPVRFVQGYQLLEVLGEGGMGIIWKARREGIARFIALKRIRSTGQPSPEALARFRREAEAVSHLRHENIVQIYDVGEQDGEPYPALEYVEGGNLAQKLSAGPLPPRQAATLVETLARAIHHAHQRGIIHRDLKPANVLFDENGVPKICDFGLAKQLDAATAHTQTGAILGTPSYMAPEQAEGGQAAIGPAVDVYALGAILYETLTGRPPFRGPTILDTLAQVRQREPVPPRQLQPSVPRDLQTICLKCLHKEPRRRFGSAWELAEDLLRFIAGEPIRARPVSWRERLRKWARRKPALAALLAVCSLFLTILIVGGLGYNARLRAAVKQAEDKDDQTRRQYRQAHDTLDRMLSRLESQQLAEVPQRKELQRSLLEDALAFYQGILQQADSPDPAVRKDTAVACKRAADIQQILGQYDSARENYRRAIELTEGLPAEDPDSPGIQTLKAGCYLNWAQAAGSAGQVQESERHNRTARNLLEQLVRERPDDPLLRNELAKAEHNRGGFLIMVKKKPAEAEPHYRKAVSLRLALVREHPEEETYQAALAANYQNLGLLYHQTGRDAEASSTFAKAEALLRPLVDRYPAESKYALPLVALYITSSYGLSLSGRSEEALDRLALGVRLAEDALRREPQDRAARTRAIEVHGTRAEIFEFLKRFVDAAKEWDRVIELESGPARIRWRWSRALCLARAGATPEPSPRSANWLRCPRPRTKPSSSWPPSTR